MLIEKKGIEVFEKFASYGVVSEFLYCASITRGVKRVPMVASIAVDYSEFHSDVPSDCRSDTLHPRRRDLGVEWKRGALAERRQKRRACLSRWRLDRRTDILSRHAGLLSRGGRCLGDLHTESGRCLLLKRLPPVDSS